MNRKLYPFRPSITEILDREGNDYTLLGSNTNNYLIASCWLETNFPILSWCRIDWSSVENSLCKNFSDDLDVQHLFEEIKHDYNLCGNVTISWSNALKFPLEIDISLISKYAEEIFQEDWDTWIYSDRYKWCIEAFHTGEICFGYSQSVI